MTMNKQRASKQHHARQTDLLKRNPMGVVDLTDADLEQIHGGVDQARHTSTQKQHYTINLTNATLL